MDGTYTFKGLLPLNNPRCGPANRSLQFVFCTRRPVRPAAQGALCTDCKKQTALNSVYLCNKCSLFVISVLPL